MKIENTFIAPPSYILKPYKPRSRRIGEHEAKWIRLHCLARYYNITNKKLRDILTENGIPVKSITIVSKAGQQYSTATVRNKDLKAIHNLMQIYHGQLYIPLPDSGLFTDSQEK